MKKKPTQKKYNSVAAEALLPKCSKCKRGGRTLIKVGDIWVCRECEPKVLRQ